MASAEVRVMIVDDSAVVRQVLSEVLGDAPGLRVLAVAADPIIAEQKLALEWPDVIVLDIEMPRMDGLTFLRRLMQRRPTPVVICSSLAQEGAATTLEALAAGAVAVVAKPLLGLKHFLETQAPALVDTVRAAAQAKPRPSSPPRQVLEPLAAASRALSQTTEKVVAIGTSTGGTQALERVLAELPRVVPGLVIVQHMPERFTAAFATRLNGLCQIEVKEAEHGDRVLPGRALIAPGGQHMKLQRSGATYRVDVLDGPPVNRHRPSVDVLFRSVALHAGRNATGVIMTGMGDDGARGLLDMRNHGARTFAQDEASCVVFGMPAEAIKLGAAEQVLGLAQIGPEIARIAL